MSRVQHTKLTCDRCLAVTEEPSVNYPDGWVILLQRDNQWNGKDLKVDLCPTCRLLLEKFLTTGVRA